MCEHLEKVIQVGNQEGRRVVLECALESGKPRRIELSEQS